jgi:ABC-type Zn uptake system ZnuABC Zn-binding protein ZnuA
MRRVVMAAIALSLGMSGCSGSEQQTAGDRLVVATSTIVEDIVRNIGGDELRLVSLIPNGFDSHTYEPKPSEIEMLEQADLVILADAGLNQKITQLAQLAAGEERLLDLNATALEASDLINKPGSSRGNPHTWTDPNLVAKWVPVIAATLVERGLVQKTTVEANAREYLAELTKLDNLIRTRLDKVAKEQRRLVVYHDAWEYFARQYDLDLVGVLQAVDFAEPSAGEVEDLVREIRDLQVKVFFGSEVFPSDVLETLERESGARYVSDLADDQLIGKPGDTGYGYIPLMEQNLELLEQGLRS